MHRAIDRWRSELRWALRNVAARGWRGVLAVALLAVTMAANAIVFATADSLVFRRVPYPGVRELVTFENRDPRTGRSSGSFASAAALDEWRRQTDLFAAVEGHLYKVIFLVGDGEPELVDAADVTTGLIDLLRVRPRWGRTFVAGDEQQSSPQPVLIAESLARERFGDPSRAVGQTLQTTADPLHVVGVMPATFRFPDGLQRIWRVFHPRGPLAKGYGISLIARTAPGVPFDLARQLVERRSAAVHAAAGASRPVAGTLATLRGASADAVRRRMLLALVGAALSLLFIACANVASLELAGAMARVRTSAIQLALGASRAGLARTALLEGVLLAGGAFVLGSALAYILADVAVRYLPPALAAGSVNPIDIDERALLFMLALAAAAWLVASAPATIFASRGRLAEVLKLEGSSVTASPGGAMLRRLLTVAQVALAVVLLAGSILYARSYVAVLRLDKGFDSSGVVAISLGIPPHSMPTGAERRALTAKILERVRALPGVVAAFEGSPPPSTGDSPTIIDRLEVDDRPPIESDLLFPRLSVEPDYFTVLRIPLVAGRMFEPGEPPVNVIITEALAWQLWPGESALGRRFRISPRMPWNYVIGVAGHVRTLRDGTSGPSRYFQVYAAKQPPPPPRPTSAQPRTAYAGPAYSFLSVTVRVDSPARLRDLYAAVRAIDGRNILSVESVDDQYARHFADRLLATRIITAFGILAFIVAAAGIYGLMAFLVADREREIGIRMALGADARAVARLVLGSSFRLAGIGVALGIAGAASASRWVQSQLFGVSATDPATLAAVAGIVFAAAVVATWQPARHAARVDPKVLLRN